MDLIATTYWAAHLGLSPAELFAEPFRAVSHREELADYDGAFALFRGGASVVSLPPARAATLQLLFQSHSTTHSPASFAHSLASVSTTTIGPAYIGYATSAPALIHPVRALGPEDAGKLDALRHACDAVQWEHGGSPIDHKSSGVFLDETLVALAGYEVWGKTIAHIAVITHPEFLGHGYGRSAVAHLAGRAIVAGLLPQYRTLESNRPSMRIATALGFSAYATSMAVRF